MELFFGLLVAFGFWEEGEHHDDAVQENEPDPHAAGAKALDEAPEVITEANAGTAGAFPRNLKTRSMQRKESVRASAKAGGRSFTCENLARMKLGDNFQMMDEWYSLMDFSSDLHVLLVQETEGMTDLCTIIAAGREGGMLLFPLHRF